MVTIKTIGTTIFMAAISAMMISAVPAVVVVVYAQVDADTVFCLFNPAACGFAQEQERQEEFSQQMEEAIEEAQREETAESFGVEEENVPTVDELLDEASQEGDARRALEREQMAENGIEVDEETDQPIAVSAEVRPKGHDPQFAIQFLNQTFTPIMNISPTDVEEYEESVDPDEEEEQQPRQTITFEFNPENPDDDIRIYTVQGQTVQGIATHIATNLNSTDITLYGDGRAMIVCEGASLAAQGDDTTIYAPHNYTTANGYVYANGTIIRPTGEQLLSTDYGMFGIEGYQTPAEMAQEC
jgi:hypothetical protein